MRIRHIAAALLLAGLLSLAVGISDASTATSAQAAGGGIGIRLTEVPVSARADTRAWSYIVDHLPPGSVIHRRVEVFNTTTSSRRVSVYAAAGAIRDRRFQFGTGRAANELTAWTSTDRHELTLAPNGRSLVTVTIAVPRNAAPGERYAVVWAETTSAAPRGGGVAKVNRVGIRIYLSVGPGNAPASAFTIDSMTAQRSPEGRQFVETRVTNTGGRALDLIGDLKLSHGPGNLNAGPFKVQTGTTLAPGDVGSVTATLGEQVPDGPWRARIRLESGLTKRAAEATIRFPAAAGVAGAVAAVPDAGHYPLLVLIIGVALMAGALLLAATLLLAERRRRAARSQSDV